MQHNISQQEEKFESKISNLKKAYDSVDQELKDSQNLVKVLRDEINENEDSIRNLNDEFEKLNKTPEPRYLLK